MEHPAQDDPKKIERRPGGRELWRTELTDEMVRSARERIEHVQQEALRAHPDTARTLHAWLKKVDWKTLQSIYAEYVQRSGVDMERLNFPDSIRFDRRQDRMMAYDGVTNSVLISLDSYAAQLQHGPTIEGEVDFLHGVIHEWAHGAAVVDAGVSARTGRDQKRSTVWRFGYEQGVSSSLVTKAGDEQQERYSLFNLFNEGVTEQLTLEVLLEYVRRQPVGEFRHVAQHIVHTTERDAGAYDAARYLLMAMVQTIAHDADLPHDVVWRGFVREYFAGEMSAGETQRWLTDVFGSDFSTKVSTVQTASELRVLASSLPHVSRRDLVDQWLSRLELGRGAK